MGQTREAFFRLKVACVGGFRTPGGQGSKNLEMTLRRISSPRLVKIREMLEPFPPPRPASPYRTLDKPPVGGRSTMVVDVPLPEDCLQHLVKHLDLRALVRASPVSESAVIV
jgi:hypothetical protein